MEEPSTVPTLSSSPLRSETESLERSRSDGGGAGGRNFTSRGLDRGEREDASWPDPRCGAGV